jgi:Myb-like DNA-binding domain
MPRIRWTPEEDERLLDLIAAGKSWTLISACSSAVKLHAKTLRLVGAKKNEAEGNEDGETARTGRNGD